MNTFTELNLAPALEKALSTLGYTIPTDIQTKSLPFSLAGKDVIGVARTGTGKTLAYALPLLQNLSNNRNSGAVILVPTRELALQVRDEFRKLCQFDSSLSMALLIGGDPMFKQIADLRRRRVRILVATPGRLMDHLERGTVELSNASFLVLDEADRMLDFGFLPQIQEIIRQIPNERQTLLFSATLDKKIQKLTEPYMKTPERVDVVGKDLTVEKIKQTELEVKSEDKNKVLMDHLNLLSSKTGSVLIFVRTQSRTERLTDTLEKHGYSVDCLHGGLTQGKRKRALVGFKKGEFKILVATDVAARGLDVDHVQNVVNYDLPQMAEDYVHRIGRTGRAGREGEALSFISPDERHLWRAIQRFLGKEVSGGGGQGGGPRRNFSQRSGSSRRGSDSRGFSRGGQRFSSSKSNGSGDSPRRTFSDDRKPNFRKDSERSFTKPNRDSSIRTFKNEEGSSRSFRRDDSQRSFSREESGHRKIQFGPTSSNINSNSSSSPKKFFATKKASSGPRAWES